MPWLEIDGDRIKGVHSDRCKSAHQWVEYDGDAKPGDRFIDEKVVPMVEPVDIEEKKRRQARHKIIAVYPEWKQLNILRQGDPTTIAEMGTFIDAVRAWSNDLSSSDTALQKIKAKTT